nr:PilZ domain-containing protein [Desulfobulbaceae bacterium]
MKNEFVDKRKHKRHIVPEDVIAVYQDRVGRVIDISEGGMRIKLIDSSESIAGESIATFYCSITNTKIKAFSLKLIREENINYSRFASLSTKTVGAEFKNPNDSHLDQIRRYISELSSAP